MMIAREVMPEDFHTRSPADAIAEAVKRFQTASEAEKKKVFGLMVTDEDDHLVNGTFYLTTAHTDADIDFTLNAYQRCLNQIL